MSEALFDPGAGIDLDALMISQIVGDVRDLTETDHRLLVLHGPTSAGSFVEIQTLRAAHHTIARMVAMGTLNQNDIAEVTGYSIGRISHLVNHSKAFQDLVEYYRERATEAVLDHHSKIHFAAGLSVELVTEELMEKADSLSPDFKLRAMEKLLDRAGHAPTAKVNHFHHQGLSAERILQLKKQADERERNRANSIDAIASPEQATGEDSGAEGSGLPALPEGNPRDLQLGMGERAGTWSQPSAQVQPQVDDAETEGGEEVRTEGRRITH